jgi:hypothetical protein
LFFISGGLAFTGMLQAIAFVATGVKATCAYRFFQDKISIHHPSSAQ